LTAASWRGGKAGTKPGSTACCGAGCRRLESTAGVLARPARLNDPAHASDEPEPVAAARSSRRRECRPPARFCCPSATRRPRVAGDTRSTETGQGWRGYREAGSPRSTPPAGGGPVPGRRSPPQRRSGRASPPNLDHRLLPGFGQSLRLHALLVLQSRSTVSLPTPRTSQAAHVSVTAMCKH
jgi:hypothetical protein